MCFTKFSILIKVSSQKSYIGNSYLFITLCPIGSITSAFSLKILGQKVYGGVIKLVAVINMVLNFLLTDKSIMEERFYVPSQVSKYSSTSSLLSSILVKKGRGIWDDSRTSQKSPRATLYSVC